MAGTSVRGRASNRWNIESVSDEVRRRIYREVQIATDHIYKKILQNINVPVVYTFTGAPSSFGTASFTNSGWTVERSLPGEYPRTDTGELRRTLTMGVRVNKNHVEGIIATPLDYGAILELSSSLRRTYMRRTFEEERETVMRFLTGGGGIS